MRIVSLVWLLFWTVLVYVAGYGIIYQRLKWKKNREKRKKEIEKWQNSGHLVSEINENEKDFLIAFYKDQQDEMRERRSPEYHILSGGLISFPFVINAAILLCRTFTDIAPLLSIGFIVFIGLLYFLMSRRISANHELYEIISRNVVRLWFAFGMFRGKNNSFLVEDAKYYGIGKGYLVTMRIVLLLAVCSLVILLLLGIRAIEM